jgi:hypothetical protein
MMQEFVQQIEETARAVVDDIHTALPGTVVSFDPGKGTATVKPNGKYLTADRKTLEYPQITDVPVVFPFCQTAGVGIAYPVLKGDSCLIVVSEVELDEWRSGAESEGSLRFDLTSAMCIPGLLEGGGSIISKACSNNAVIVGAGDVEVMVSDSGAVVTSGNTKMTVSDAGVAISGDLNVDGNISFTGSITPHDEAN